MDNKTWALAQKAETLRLSGAYEQAIEIFKELQRKDKTDNAWLNAHLGTIYYELMDYAKAEEYLTKAVEKNDNYLWAHAHLGETYRLRAITENDKEQKNESIKSAIEHFEKALAHKAPENSNYGWALAHLGATYRLKITLDKIKLIKKNEIDQESKQQALNYLNRAIELMPTYAWAWGMRSTVHRLAQEYEESLWDLGVETQISPDMETLQHSYYPVSSLVSRRVSLYEHAFLFFYLTKREDNSEKKERYYSGAIACTQQVLILKPGDLIGQLILKIIEGTQKKEKDKINNKFREECQTLIEKIDANLAEICKAVLIYMIKAEPKTKEKLEMLAKEECMSGHKLKKLVDDVLKKFPKNIEPKNIEPKNIEPKNIEPKNIEPKNIYPDNPEIKAEAQLWLWQNFGWVEGSASALSFLADLSEVLRYFDQHCDDITGEPLPYRVLALIIYDQYALERIFQSLPLSEEERVDTFKKLLPWIKPRPLA
ncbi:tetratricopeptide repeat protein [Moorena producens]|uniref:tetratricopeptide repeat protein n=1 Tax=Moorena producens TaxID=1155739 RepID=UPI003C7715D4